MTDDLARIDREFVDRGYIVVDLSDRKPLDRARDALGEALREASSTPHIDFSNYHEHVRDGEEQTTLQAALTARLRTGRYAQQIVASELPFFRSFLGPDLCVQRLPYVRIARPGVAEDNVDIHRDTQYGRSPFELSVWIPFVEITAEMALRVLPGSHISPESEFPFQQLARPDVPRGSLKHQLGFPYAPKKMDAEVEKRMIPVPVRYGQILLFSLSIVHGQRLNEGLHTRFSGDVRVVHAFAPIAWEASVSGAYYEPLCRSAVTEQAERYRERNGLPVPVGAGVGSH